MLRQRVATGVAVALAFLVALFALPAIYLSAISATVLVFAAWEWAALAGLADQRLRTAFTAIVGLGSLLVWWLLVERTLLTQSFMLGLFALGVLLWLLLLAAVIKYPASSFLLHSVRARLVLGVLVLLLASTGFTFLSVHPLGKFW
ncbi:MAG: hypothetical protein KJO24_00405, partial [Gammaproteobacteria bacterium]|nr:hypothetical protein [Gammaproteobacteria bacterium]